jgi:hypothetical protein
VQKTTRTEIIGADEGALGLANCKAWIEYSANGYLALLGWIQLVRSTDNASQGRQFEVDLFDPFKLYARAPTPYFWYGITPTFFDAPSRDERVELDWVAHTFLATSPWRGNRRVVIPLLGFSWGFHIIDDKNIDLKPPTSLTSADWESHLPYLQDYYKQWDFTEMP